MSRKGVLSVYTVHCFSGFWLSRRLVWFFYCLAVNFHSGYADSSSVLWMSKLSILMFRMSAKLRGWGMVMVVTRSASLSTNVNLLATDCVKLFNFTEGQPTLTDCLLLSTDAALWLVELLTFCAKSLTEISCAVTGNFCRSGMEITMLLKFRVSWVCM